jgi:hypothetical protein
VREDKKEYRSIRAGASSLLRLFGNVLTCGRGDAALLARLPSIHGRVGLRSLAWFDPRLSQRTNDPRTDKEFPMSNDTAASGLIKTYFWMVHYDVTPVAQSQSDAGLKPIAAGRKRGIAVVCRNVYANHVWNFNMPRESEGATPDPAQFRGSTELRNRIIGFYATPEEANAHLNGALWAELQQKAGAIYAELHSLRLDVAEAKPETLKLVA